MESRVLLGDEEVKEMTFEDFATFEIKVKKTRETPGYVLCKDHPYLVPENFLVMVSYMSNLMFLAKLEFPNGKDEVVIQYQHRQAVEKQMKFSVNLISLNYPNMDINGELNLDVLAPTAVNFI